MFIGFSIAIIISSFFPDRFILCSLLILKIPLERIKSCNNLNIIRYLPVERIEKVLDKTHLALSWVSHKVGWGTLFPPCIILLILSSHHRHCFFFLLKVGYFRMKIAFTPHCDRVFGLTNCICLPQHHHNCHWNHCGI